jgi:NAD(P)-dependent dehydrogenase (short-subunit alcohol dehydrogenase family)
MVLPPVTVVKRPSRSAGKTVLITGCSHSGLGDALAQAFHKRGLRVIATARNPAKIAHFKALGIETLLLDVLSAQSISDCVSAVSDLTGGSLDILINNSGAGHNMPLADTDIAEARKTFDLNVWALLAVTQAFLPLLLESSRGAMVINNTSIVSVTPVPMQGIYNASKAAAAMLTDNLRIELAPFKIKVVDLRTGAVHSNIFDNLPVRPVLPKDSIYAPAREPIENSMAGKTIPPAIPAQTWAEQVVRDLLSAKPPTHVWRGQSAWMVWFIRRFMPYTSTDGVLAKMSGLNVLAERLPQGKGRQSLFSRILARVIGV